MKLTLSALRTWTVAGAMLAAFHSVAAAAEDARETITVTGTGSVAVQPDRAEISVAVVATGKDADAAVAANSAVVRRLLDRLAGLGVKAEQTRTTRFDVSPQHEREKPGQRGGTVPPAIVGYVVTNRLQVGALEIDEVGRILDEVVKGGANRVAGIRFVVANPEPHLERAMRAAIADARRRAAVYADAAGATVGRILWIRERGAARPQPLTARMLEAATVPVRPGTQNVTASVSVSFALGNSGREP